MRTGSSVSTCYGGCGGSNRRRLVLVVEAPELVGNHLEFAQQAGPEPQHVHYELQGIFHLGPILDA